MILDAAISFFAENGFSAQTRELATEIGVSQSLIYRYFKSKEDLVEQVYQKTFLLRWNPVWEVLLTDRTIPIRTRLIDFFRSYLGAIDDRYWIRISMYSSLSGWDMTHKYISIHVNRIIDVIVSELGLDEASDKALAAEMVWHLHSSFIYYLVRKYIHRTQVYQDTGTLVSSLVDIYLDGLPMPDSRRSSME